MTDLCNEINALGKGIGNENRYHILEALMQGKKTVGQIAEKVHLAQPAVSQHLKVLKSANLVLDERHGQEVHYAINVAYMAGLLKRLSSDVERGKGKR